MVKKLIMDNFFTYLDKFEHENSDSAIYTKEVNIN